MTDNSFVDIELSSNNIDRYHIRRSIFEVIKNHLKYFHGSLLDVGCGKMPYRDYIKNNSIIKEYVGLDIESALEYDSLIKPDFVWDGDKMPFDDNSFDVALATEVFEHCPNVAIVLDEIYRVLKPEGLLLFTVPFLWPLHEVPNDEHRFTPFALKKQLTNANFMNIDIKATGGWHASMAQMLGLWVKRGINNKRLKKFLSICFKPLIKFLISKDKIPVQFKEGDMCTGFYGIANKKND